MIFEQIRTGGDRNLAYLIGNEEAGEALLVDPSYSPDECVNRAEYRGLKVKYILNTHGDSDHTNGNRTVKERTGAQVVAAGLHADIRVGDGDHVSLGEMEIMILHTPGHTGDSICILVEDKLMTGDTLFVGKVGGTGYGEDAREEYESLHRLMELPDRTEVWPGHDVGVSPSSTIGDEKRTNPFLLQPSLEEFVNLKRNWAEYKRKHGIK